MIDEDIIQTILISVMFTSRAAHSQLSVENKQVWSQGNPVMAGRTLV